MVEDEAEEVGGEIAGDAGDGARRSALVSPTGVWGAAPSTLRRDVRTPVGYLIGLLIVLMGRPVCDSFGSLLLLLSDMTEGR